MTTVALVLLTIYLLVGAFLTFAVWYVAFTPRMLKEFEKENDQTIIPERVWIAPVLLFFWPLGLFGVPMNKLFCKPVAED
jgi:hypothetical protein